MQHKNRLNQIIILPERVYPTHLHGRFGLRTTIQQGGHRRRCRSRRRPCSAGCSGSSCSGGSMFSNRVLPLSLLPHSLLLLQLLQVLIPLLHRGWCDQQPRLQINHHPLAGLPSLPTTSSKRGAGGVGVPRKGGERAQRGTPAAVSDRCRPSVGAGGAAAKMIRG